MSEYAGQMAHLLDDPRIERDWITPCEFGKIIGVDETTVHYWIAAGWITSHRKPKDSKNLVYPNSDKWSRHQIPNEEVDRLISFVYNNYEMLSKFVPRLTRGIHDKVLSKMS